jgi:hypothetical protein
MPGEEERRSRSDDYIKRQKELHDGERHDPADKKKLVAIVESLD